MIQAVKSLACTPTIKLGTYFTLPEWLPAERSTTH